MRFFHIPIIWKIYCSVKYPYKPGLSFSDCPSLNTNIVTVGIHLRHQDIKDAQHPELCIKGDTAQLNTIKEVIISQSDKKCYVFLSTDRLITVEVARNITTDIGCELITAPKESSRANMLTNPVDIKGRPMPGNEVEHGPWIGSQVSIVLYFSL